MSPERWQQIQAVFDAALQRDGEREAFLAQACAGDPKLRAEVDELLAHDAQVERVGFLGDSCPHGVVSGPTPSAHRPVLPGPVALPGYEILEELGRGGMGVVYKAWQVKPRRLVALKMILAGAQPGPEQLSRFQTEAEAVARLEHPHIVRLYDYGEWQGLPYFSMELVDRGNLAQKLRGTPQPAREAAQLVETLALAMQYAHQRGIVHRDLKPANILLGGEAGASGTSDPALALHHLGTPKIADFGLAKQLNAGVGPTQSGAVLGTPSYMAPEQAAGHAKHIGPATDVYALGAILYQLLTGRPPFQAATPLETLGQVVSQEPVSVSRLQPRVPRDLQTICLKCLQKEPHRRYASAQDLADELRRFLEGKPIRARPPGLLERTVKWAQRRPAVAALLAALVLALLAGTAISWTFALQAEERAREAERHRREAECNLYLAHMREIQDAWAKGNTAQVVSLLERYRPERTQGIDLRGFEWYYWDRLCHADRLTLAGHVGAVLGVAYHPDGQRLASAGADRTVRIWDAATGRTLRILRGEGGRICGVAFSPDGKHLASASEGGMVRVWDVASGDRLLSLKRHDGPVNALAFSADGKWLASAGADKTVCVWDAATGRALHTLKGHDDQVRSVAFSPSLPDAPRGRLASGGWDGKVKLWNFGSGQEAFHFEGQRGRVHGVAFSPAGRWLASGSSDKTVQVWDTATGEKVRTLDAHAGLVRSVAFSPASPGAPNGWLATASDDLAVKVWDTAIGQEKFICRGHTGGVTCITFRPDGRELASASRDGTVRIWDAAPRPEPLTLAGHGDKVYGVSFSPDGKRLASASQDGTVRLWDVRTGQGTLVLRGHVGRVNNVAFGPDGKRLASAGADGKVRVWDAATGQKLLSLEGHDREVVCVAFSPDGSWLASAEGIHADPVTPSSRIKIWELARGQEVRTLRGHTHSINGVAFSPDGRWLASASRDRTVKVWNLADGREARTFEVQSNEVVGLAFSPDGKRLASAGWDWTVKVWDLASGRVTLTLKGHKGNVHGVAFSPDGKRLASASWDGTVRIWETVHGEGTLTLYGHNAAVYSVAFSPDGWRLASASLDGTSKVWGAKPSTP